MVQPGFKCRQPRRFSTVSAWLSSPDRRPLASSWAPGPGSLPLPSPATMPIARFKCPQQPHPEVGGIPGPFHPRPRRAGPGLGPGPDRQGEAGLRFPTAPPAGQSESSPGALAQARPTALGTLCVYRGPFFQQAQSTFPSVISLARAQPQECGRAQHFPTLQRQTGRAPACCCRSRKELLSPTFSATDEQTEAQRGTGLPK